jgi:hypothetical protein
MRTRTTAILFLVVPVCFAMGWRHQPKVKVVDLSAARIEQ